LHRIFNSVILGITLMGLIALYIAIGSGFPRLRELFEMNELQFFNAWPLKTLMASAGDEPVRCHLDAHPPHLAPLWSLVRAYRHHHADLRDRFLLPIQSRRPHADPRRVSRSIIFMTAEWAGPLRRAPAAD